MSICTFCGHATVNAAVRQPLYEAIERLIEKENVACFYVGNHGGFDRMVLGVLKELKKRHPQMEYYEILAYMPGTRATAQYTDELATIYPEGLETVPPKFAITARNRWMVDQSSHLIAYVSHDFGGAAQTFRYARSKKSLEIINLSGVFDGI